MSSYSFKTVIDKMCREILYIYIYIGGCPSDPMMTFVFYNLSMNTEVAPQPLPRGTES